MNPVAMTIINPQKEYCPSWKLYQRPPVLKTCTLLAEPWGLARVVKSWDCVGNQVSIFSREKFFFISFFPSFTDEARDLNQGVLVHCLAGISRSVTITVAYLMKRKKLSLNEAYDYVKTCKPNISPNFNFMGQLLEFQKSLGHTPNCKCVEKCTCSHLSLISQAPSTNHGSSPSST